MKPYHERLKEARQKACLKVAAAAKLVGYTASSLHNFEAGRRVPPARNAELIIEAIKAHKP